LAGFKPKLVAQIAIVYEPEWTIGVQEPASPDAFTAVCTFIRRWIDQEYGRDVAAGTRII
jgi:triosephosphate isomerase